ncbi:MAG: ABC transporter permease subunit [Rhizobiales bacterium]|nr:ABC transporter permease subunit [Hyphomicrobiales bacterium]
MKTSLPQTNTFLGSLLIGGLLLLIALSFFWTPYDPLGLDLASRLKPPSIEHWAGTDEFGRDVFSRAMTGARISALISSFTVIIAVIFGTTLGLLAGYLRGWTDRALMTLTDALLSFPGVLLALGLMVVLGASQFGLVVALGLAYMPAVIRVVRSAVLSIREKEFIEASLVIGNSEFYTMLRHVLPNAIAPIAVLATSMFGWALLSESALSFLGLGVSPPTPTWGNMLASSRPYMETAIWLGIVPGICITATLLGVNLLGDSLRDYLDPRTNGS